MKFAARGLAKNQADEDHETVMRLRATMDGYLASHGRDAMISVLYVRDLINPRGLWALDPERDRREPKTEKPLELSPGADPITGCKPVTPDA
jgi:hypothetical protein